MKRPTIFLLTSAALFAGGFFVGNNFRADEPDHVSLPDRTLARIRTVPQPDKPATPRDAFRMALHDAQRPFDASEMARLHRATPLPELMHHPLVSQWVETAPARVLQWLDRVSAWPRGDDEFKTFMLDTLFTAWATNDATAALAAARDREPSACKAAALKGVIGGTRRSDPETAAKALLAWVEAGLDDGDPLYADEPSPSEDLALVRRLPPSAKRAKLKGDVMRAAMDDKAAEASAIWIAASKEERREMVRGGFMPAEQHLTSQRDGETAAVPFPGAFDLAIAAVEEAAPDKQLQSAYAFWRWSGREWATRDFSAAMQWMRQHSTPIEFVGRLEEIAKAAAPTQPAAILATVPSLESLPQKVAVLWVVSASCPPNQRATLEALVAELPPESRELIATAAKE